MTERMKDLRMTRERTRPNLIRNIILCIVSVSVSWEMSGYPPLPWEYSGIIGDFTHWHLFLNFLQLQMSESQPAAPPHKSKYFIIIKDIFLSSLKDFSFDRTQCIVVIALSFASAHLSPESQTVGEEGGWQQTTDSDGTRRENIPRLMRWLVTCDAVSWQSRHTAHTPDWTQ